MHSMGFRILEYNYYTTNWTPIYARNQGGVGDGDDGDISSAITNTTPIIKFWRDHTKSPEEFLRYPIIQARKREIKENAQRDCSIWYATTVRYLWAIIVVLVVKTILIMVIKLKSRATIERQQ
jgi:hypothetical protein